ENLGVAIIPDKDMGLALGRGEANRELAQQLTGVNIELIKESEFYESTMSEETEMDIEDLPGLSAAVVDRLREAGINTAEELKGLGLQGLMEIPGIGQKTAQRILGQLNI
ncbi:MAG: hypothetical protein KDH98_14045, partial [Calditrichaeota bacterium]|nr:hypothetical protein [Calditrichota bacterium]